MLDRQLHAPRRILRLIFAITLIRLCQRVRGVVGFFQVVLLDGGGALEGLTCFAAGFLEAEGVGRLGVEVYCVFVFFGFAAEEGEAAAGALGCFVGLPGSVLVLLFYMVGGRAMGATYLL